jgi:hypothetical protein
MWRMLVWAMFPLLINALSVVSTSAQAYRVLTADDFLGAPGINNRGVVAYTNCTIDFKYEATRHNGYYLLHCDIILTVNHYKSWLDRSRIKSKQVLDEVLKHEQGHYTIAYLEQQELKRVIGRTFFGADYQYRAKAIFDRIDAKYKQLNYDYDEDTGHMVNRDQQKSWDEYFKKQLTFMPAS